MLPSPMLGGFDPRSDSLFFSRRRSHAIFGALALYGAAMALALSQQGAEETIEVELQPDLQDFAVEEEEPPPEEEEPPPPPPPDAKIDPAAKPKPKPKIKPPEAKPQAVAPESDAGKTYAPSQGTADNNGTAPQAKPVPPKPKVDPPKPKADPPKPKPKPPAEAIDPDKPIDRPENASAPKPEAGNPSPTYPESLRDQGITGEVAMKIHVHRDGSVRGAKILRKRSSATTEEERTAAEKLFVQAAISAVKKWRFTPAKIGGEAITVWHTVTFPFSLTGG